MDLFLLYSRVVVCDSVYCVQIHIFRNAENYDKIRYISSTEIVVIASAYKVTMAINDRSNNKHNNTKQFCGRHSLE